MEGDVASAVDKKDSDALTSVDPHTGHVFVTTSVDMTSLLGPEVQTAPGGGGIVDVHVRVVRHMFVVHSIFTACAIVIALFLIIIVVPPRGVAIVLISVACPVCAALYVVASWVAHKRRRPRDALMLVCGWWATVCAVLGCACVLMGDDPAPAQFASMVWAQCMAVIVYTALSRRTIDVTRAMLYMALATMAVWGASIALFYSDREWGAAIVSLCVAALVCIPYHGHQVRAARGRYSVGTDDLAHAVVCFYVDPALWLISATSP